jgi:hypothetical protein
VIELAVAVNRVPPHLQRLGLVTVPADRTDTEPEWLWATRITAEAARAAMVNGRTPRERAETYERLILTAREERQRGKNPEPGAKASTSISGGSLYNQIDFTDITLSGFDEPTPTDPV